MNLRMALTVDGRDARATTEVALTAGAWAAENAVCASLDVG